jgi:hypothetical protein
MIWFEPFLVIGPGRSGTSFVARVLHERLGVHMGDSFRTDETNPNGFYEDLWFKENNQALIDGRLSEKDWHKSFQTLLIDRRSRGVPWGLKDPRIAHVWPMMSPYMSFSRTIRCRRNIEDIVKSCIRCYGWSPETAFREIQTREDKLDELPSPIRNVYIDKKPTEKDVVKLLQGVINE